MRSFSYDTATSGGQGRMILSLAATLIAIGVVMVFSTTSELNGAFWPDRFIRSTPWRQAAFALAGIVFMWLAYALGYGWSRWRVADNYSGTKSSLLFQPSAALLILAILLLIAAAMPGVGAERHGARRWLHFGQAFGLGFQPSELAKVITVLFMASWLASRRQLMSGFWKGLLPTAAVVGIVAALIVPEDLGTAALITLVGGIMILAAGARWWHALLLALPALLGFAGMIIAKPYRVQRILSFTDPWSDPLGSGYHAIQSLTAIASGGWRGLGLGAGIQKYGYLPEAHSDFIFAVICEELGSVGGLMVLMLFMALTWMGWRIVCGAPDMHAKLLGLGLVLMIGFQAAMNIAVVTASVPTKGISLPFVSAGGSGIVIYSITVGLLASIARTKQRAGSAD